MFSGFCAGKKRARVGPLPVCGRFSFESPVLSCHVFADFDVCVVIARWILIQTPEIDEPRRCKSATAAKHPRLITFPNFSMNFLCRRRGNPAQTCASARVYGASAHAWRAECCGRVVFVIFLKKVRNNVENQ